MTGDEFSVLIVTVSAAPFSKPSLTINRTTYVPGRSATKVGATPAGLASIATLAALTVLYRPEELPVHLRRAIDNGLTLDEISALITHVAFYGGFPAAISASMIAADTLLDNDDR